MMKRRKRKEEKKFIVNICIFTIISIFFLSIGYSALSQNLYVSGTSTIDYKEVKSMDFEFTCSENRWTQGNRNYFQCQPGTISYSGNEEVYSWSIAINLPDGAALEACYGNTTCEVKDGKLYIYSSDINGKLQPGRQIQIGFLISSNEYYDGIDVDSTNIYNFTKLNPKDEDVANCLDTSLTMSNLSWTTQLNFNIKNNTRETVYYWEAVIPLPPNTRINNMYGSDYIITDDSIILYGIIDQNYGQMPPGNNKNVVINISSYPSGYRFYVESVKALVVNSGNTKVCGVN